MEANPPPETPTATTETPTTTTETPTATPETPTTTPGTPTTTPDNPYGLDAEAQRRLSLLPPIVRQYLARLTPPAMRSILGNPELLMRICQSAVALPPMVRLPTPAVAKPPAPRGRPRKKVNDYDDEDSLPPLESSDEAEFSYSEENDEEEDKDFEDIPLDYVPDLPKRVVETRQNKKRVQRDNEEVFGDDSSEEEEEYEYSDGMGEVVNRVEHIYMERTGKNGQEFLLRFQESPPGMCQWVPEDVVEVLPKARGFIDRFREMEAKASVEDLVMYPVAHRKNEEDGKMELLFRIMWESNAMFVWDTPDEETLEKYLANRKCFKVEDPVVPEGELPEPDTSLLTSESGDVLRDYQVQGVRWMIDCWRQGHGSILADEMGLGKTIQLLSFLVYLNRYAGWHGPFAIVVRANTFKQWVDEIGKWTDLACVAYQSFPSARGLMREYQFPALDDAGVPIPDTFAFNILLVTYDVFLKDIEYMEKINWEVLVLDEGHRIKNGQGKKNQVFTNINAKHRIILTGTPIQNSLVELWALLKFVSPEAFSETPEFLETELEELTNETIMEIRNLIAPHLLHRSLMDVEHSIAPKEERVVFVGLTDVQKDLIRLIKMRKAWRLKGVCQGNEEEAEGSSEPHLLFRACSHPFLIPEAEIFYTKKLRIANRADLLLRTSLKFQWLDNVLRVLQQGNHRVLIFSQRVELLMLLDEFVGMRGYTKEMLIGSMTDLEKQVAIDNYRKNNTFIFLISTKAGSEGLNLTEADTAILFDPDWNPQNDIQAQARCHRIGQTQKVDVLRLCTFQTYEHYIFVKAQRKLGLWLTILGSKDVSILHQETPVGITIEPPPAVKRIEDLTLTLDDVLARTSTVLTDFSLETLPILEQALNEANEVSYQTTDEEFLEGFPVVIEGSGKRTKRSRSRDILINKEGGERIYNSMKLLGFQKWDVISEGEEDYEADQIKRFCLMLVVLSFRAMKPVLVFQFPVLIGNLMQQLLSEGVEMSLEDLVCRTKVGWAQPFADDGFELALEVDACKKIKALITKDPLSFVSVLEARLIGLCWGKLNIENGFNWEAVAPPYTETDKDILQAIMEGEEFDPADPRAETIIDVMKADIISRDMMDQVAEITPYWTEHELSLVVGALKNFPFDSESETDLHAKTRILGKLTYDVTNFVKGLKGLLTKKGKGKGVVITEAMAHLQRVPELLQEFIKSRLQLTGKDCEVLRGRISLISLIQKKLAILEPSEPTETWGPYHEKLFLELVLKHGVDSMHAILLDQRYPFDALLSRSDRQFLTNAKKKRNLQTSSLPDFVFNEPDLMNFASEGVEPEPAEEPAPESKPKSKSKPKPKPKSKPKSKPEPEPSTTPKRTSPRRR